MIHYVMKKLSIRVQAAIDMVILTAMDRPGTLASSNNHI